MKKVILFSIILISNLSSAILINENCKIFKIESDQIEPEARKSKDCMEKFGKYINLNSSKKLVGINGNNGLILTSTLRENVFCNVNTDEFWINDKLVWDTFLDFQNVANNMIQKRLLGIDNQATMKNNRKTCYPFLNLEFVRRLKKDALQRLNLKNENVYLVGSRSLNTIWGIGDRTHKILFTQNWYKDDLVIDLVVDDENNMISLTEDKKPSKGFNNLNCLEKRSLSTGSVLELNCQIEGKDKQLLFLDHGRINRLVQNGEKLVIEELSFDPSIKNAVKSINGRADFNLMNSFLY